ncbi:ComF family protein [Candidatus Dojkabacteria bacterium]|nr:ComF family protein [Candidatus Dojkabacteria bacterium]
MKTNLGIFFKKFVDILQDIFFPKQCINCDKYGSYLCNRCRKTHLQFYSENICHVCRKETILSKILVHRSCSHNTLLNEVIPCLRYNHLTQQIIEEIKYQYNFSFVSLIIDLMLEVLDISKFRDSIFVPIPLHKSKFNKRGFNQAELIAKSLVGKLKGWKVEVEVLNLVSRTKNTKTQVGMSKVERLSNLDSAFSLNQKYMEKIERLKSKRIWLIDDVMTTGTTLEQCAGVLQSLGFKDIRAVVFARG